MLELDAEGLAVLDGDGAVLADDLHGLGDLLADFGIAGGNGADVGDLFLGFDVDRVVLDLGNDGVDALLHAAADAERVRAGDHVAQAFGDDGVGEQGCGRGAVARFIVGLHSGFAHKLGAHVFDRSLELDFLGNRHAVVGDERSAIGLFEGDVAALGAKGDLNGVGELLHAGGELAASVGIELYIFSHAS